MNEQTHPEHNLNLAHRKGSVFARRPDTTDLRAVNLSRRQFEGNYQSIEIDEIEHSHPVVADLPKTIKKDIIFATLNLTDLQVGKSFLDIKHHADPEAPQKPYYSTSITNRSAEQLRIDRFASYTLSGDILVLHTMTGGFFSDQQFQEWYDLGQSRWIEPGQVVTDLNNHSNLGVYWAYFGTTISGEEFVAGAPWLGPKPWWQLW
jgi:hypothetical protein